MKNIDLSKRKYKYLAAAILQVTMLYLWYMPCVKTKQALEGRFYFEEAERCLSENGLVAVNVAYVAFSVFGIALFLLPRVCKDKYVTRHIDLPVLAGLLLGAFGMFFVFAEKQAQARASTEYGVLTECSFTFNAVAFLALTVVQGALCGVCRIQANREKLLK